MNSNIALVSSSISISSKLVTHLNPINYIIDKEANEYPKLWIKKQTNIQNCEHLLNSKFTIQ